MGPRPVSVAETNVPVSCRWLTRVDAEGDIQGRHTRRSGMGGER